MILFFFVSPSRYLSIYLSIKIDRQISIFQSLTDFRFRFTSRYSFTSFLFFSFLVFTSFSLFCFLLSFVISFLSTLSFLFFLISQRKDIFERRIENKEQGSLFEILGRFPIAFSNIGAVYLFCMHSLVKSTSEQFLKNPSLFSFFIFSFYSLLPLYYLFHLMACFIFSRILFVFLIFSFFLSFFL